MTVAESASPIGPLPLFRTYARLAALHQRTVAAALVTFSPQVVRPGPGWRSGRQCARRACGSATASRRAAAASRASSSSPPPDGTAGATSAHATPLAPPSACAHAAGGTPCPRRSAATLRPPALLDPAGWTCLRSQRAHSRKPPEALRRHRCPNLRCGMRVNSTGAAGSRRLAAARRHNTSCHQTSSSRCASAQGRRLGAALVNSGTIRAWIENLTKLDRRHARRISERPGDLSVRSSHCDPR